MCAMESQQIDISELWVYGRRGANSKVLRYSCLLAGACSSGACLPHDEAGGIGRRKTAIETRP
jgi:hypothetical protein